MKMVNYIIFGLILFFTFGCKQSNNQDSAQNSETTDVVEAYQLVNDSTKVSFTAYKTTEKVPVGGQFTKINITNTTGGETALEALDGTRFSIPVSSLFTNDATGTRDPKILEFFFGAMKNTELISGVFKLSAGNQCSADVTLNGKTENIPLEVTSINDVRYAFDGVMNLEKWDALGAVNSINQACAILHTGKDGVSKTWSEVAVHGEVLLNKNIPTN